MAAVPPSVQERQQESMPPPRPTKASLNSSEKKVVTPLVAANYFDKQGPDIDAFLRAEHERIEEAVRQKRIQALAYFMSTAPARAVAFLKGMDEEITQAREKIAELEERVNKIKECRDKWEQDVTRKEAVVTVLHNALQQGHESSSACETSGGCNSAPAGGLRFACVTCCSRFACVLFLPCNHFCTCEPCAAKMDACPLCGVPKGVIIEIVDAEKERGGEKKPTGRK